MIYAFKTDDSFQTLDEHVKLCLKALDKIKSSKLYSMKGLKDDLVRLMVLYHDIGKIFYQRSNVNMLRFTGHEFISAYIFNKILEQKLVGLIEEEHEFILYLYPIIFHHHSMGVRKRIEHLSKVKLIQPSEFQLEELKMMLNNYLDKKYVKYTIEIIKSLNINKVRCFIKGEINKIFRMFHGEFARRCLQLLLILIICDYEGAKSRGKPTSFGRIIEELVKYYSVPRP